MSRRARTFPVKHDEWKNSGCHIILGSRKHQHWSGRLIGFWGWFPHGFVGETYCLELVSGVQLDCDEDQANCNTMNAEFHVPRTITRTELWRCSGDMLLFVHIICEWYKVSGKAKKVVLVQPKMRIIDTGLGTK